MVDLFLLLDHNEVSNDLVLLAYCTLRLKQAELPLMLGMLRVVNGVGESVCV